jgi:hypothetical protein
MGPEIPGSTPEVARGEFFVGEAESARGKLQRKELNRPHFLRELFWSDELRGMNST